MNKTSKTKKRQKNTYASLTIKLSQKCLKLAEKASTEQNMQSMSAFIEGYVRPYIGQHTPIRRPHGKYKLIKKTFTFTEEFIAGIRDCGNMSVYIEQELMKRIRE